MAAEHVYNGNVIDIEASGFGASSYPIEVGLVLEDGTVYNSLIRPTSQWTHWSRQAEQIHGIPREHAVRFGKTPKQVCLELNEICQGRTLFSDCWVADSDWMHKLFQEAGVEPTFHLSPIEYSVDDSFFETWQDEKKARALDHEIPLHRALADAAVIKSLLDEKLLGTHKHLQLRQARPSVPIRFNARVSQEKVRVSM